MKILILGTAYPLRGAMAQLNATLGWYLAKKHEVKIISFTRQFPRLLFPGTTQMDPGKPIYDVPTTPMVDSINPLTWFRTARHIAKMKPDLLIMRYWIPFLAPCLGVIARRVKKYAGTAVLFICDNVIPHERRPGDLLLTRFALRSADFCLVQSHAVEEDLKRLLPTMRSTVVPHPIYNIFGNAIPRADARQMLGISESDRVLLFFGYIRRYKGLDILLNAMPRILHRISVKLLVVGEFYENRERYSKLVTKHGVRQAVLIRPDYIRNEEVGKYFSAADLVVLPYRSATQSGIVQIAYHFNKPVLATQVGGLSEVVVDGTTGMLVPPEDPEALADAVVKYFEEGREQEFVSNIEQEKTKYSWERFVEAIEQMVQR